MSLAFPKPEAWVEEAACTPATADDWYGGPDGVDRRSLRKQPDPIERAKAQCARCDVRAKCLADAIRNDERWGVWGGLDFQRDRDELGRRIA